MNTSVVDGLMELSEDSTMDIRTSGIHVEGCGWWVELRKHGINISESTSSCPMAKQRQRRDDDPLDGGEVQYSDTNDCSLLESVNLEMRRAWSV
jgi:hypothetical protein